MTNEPSLMHKSRPTNLNLFSIRFPVTAIVSILHRISGVVLFLFVPFVLWLFNYSLASPDDFANLQSALSNIAYKALLWVFLVGLFYHLIAGLRHLLMDFGIGESLRSGRALAWLLLLLSLVFALFLGIWLW